MMQTHTHTQTLTKHTILYYIYSTLEQGQENLHIMEVYVNRGACVFVMKCHESNYKAKVSLSPFRVIFLLLSQYIFSLFSGRLYFYKLELLVQLAISRTHCNKVFTVFLQHPTIVPSAHTHVYVECVWF